MPNIAPDFSSNGFQLSVLPDFLSDGIATLPAESLEVLSNQQAAQIYGGIASPQAPPPNPQPERPSASPAARKPASSQWSVALQTLLDQPPANFPRLLMLGGLSFCVLFTVWAWFSRVQEVSHAQGRLVPQGEVYKVQPVMQGEIARVLAAEGQHVKAGDVIAQFDSRLANAEVDRLQQSLSAYRLQLLQTQGIIKQTQFGLDIQQAITTAQAEEQEAAIAQAKASTQTTQTILGQLQVEAEAYEERLARLQPLIEAGAFAKDRLFELEQTLRQHHRTVIQHQGQLKQSTTEAERLQAQLVQTQAKGKQDLLQMQERIQKLELEAAQLQAKITETETLLKAAQTKLEQMYLYAPVNGTISTLKLKNSGEVIQPGQTVAEITPERAPLILSALVPNHEAGLVQVNMKAQVKFDAFPYQEYGIVPGRVIAISPDAETDERGNAVYRLKIALDRKAVVHEGRTVQLKPGQTAQAEVVTRQRRLLDIFLDPIKKLREAGINL
ncbi:HlyD family type I secretion periplasmic adaptor subunit [Leptolyngbya sp. NK1-12]|uniref:HlyD family type I secretion periplasmic adaptor subunit n=1 Tax=Leptolyngbya sp. NK1-12 TaxID=2547451 RepID=A0AA97AR61_9CYAN|nr:HlyD family type I secretion periplasmic adaptor subunit [Leptolyngbya sp. NK1-12]MBF2047341.1 HlyD family type I secretion periplasmic adaptor subunit [Elainella sp. C42_A2020_010]RNJ67538.1 MAG: HlyD family type I secretion periplasmic adaptor subunit [Leptolyngbya sp. IPPAS B-1204]WNZ24798.1 HlyD family type I secretion periplasmic adaptor subunit [Leptolyngbya sp. NK1-12]